MLFERGYGAAAAFVIQRDDAEAFTPYVEADPLFAATLAAVHPRWHCWLTAAGCPWGRLF